MSKQVVVMGAGTGIYPVITALKHLNVEVTSIINVADSGGSTGRIRDEFGFQPVGDLRQSLAALAEDEGQEWIRKVLLYRFEKGEGLVGHNLGNLILTALQDMTGDTDKALEIAEKIFRLEGEVIPVTKQNVQLEIHYQDGDVAVGEHILDEANSEVKEIDHISLTPEANLNPRAAAAIQAAQLIVIGPGDYYGSLMPTLVPDGVEEAFANTQAKIVYMVNLMTRFTQTHGMTAKEHVEGIEKAIGRSLDQIVINSGQIPSDILDRYAKENEFPVEDDLNGEPRVIRADLVSEAGYEQSSVDTAHRSVLRHDSQKLQAVLKTLLND